jgi:hypothetical protein
MIVLNVINWLIFLTKKLYSHGDRNQNFKYLNKFCSLKFTVLFRHMSRDNLLQQKHIRLDCCCWGVKQVAWELYMIPLDYYLFIYSFTHALVNDIFSSADYIAQNDRMNNELQRMGMEVIVAWFEILSLHLSDANNEPPDMMQECYQCKYYIN